MAEIPGLIVGASLGRGLGHDFLRHVVRTKVLIHLLDGGSASPVEDMIQVNNELALFDSALAKKPQLVAVNKFDLPDVRARVKEIKESFSHVGIEAHFVSAATGEGVTGLTAGALAMLEEAAASERPAEIAQVKVFRPKPRVAGVSIQREGDIFVVSAPELERIVSGTDIANTEARRQLLGQLTKPMVSRALEKAGARPGDRVRCGSFEWRR